MLIDRTYFVGELNIPNATNAVIGSAVDHFISKYEDKWLKEVLGYSLAKAFKEGWTEPTPDDKWVDLVEGVEYQINGKTKFWRGLVSAVSGESSFDLNPITNYVYYWYMRNNHTQTASTGETKGKHENADWASVALKMKHAWNEMSEWICELVDYLNAKKDDYTEWADQDVWCMLKKFRPVNEFNI